MNASKAWDKLKAVETSPEFEILRAQEFPYRSVALSVVDLRGRLEMTQGQLAQRVGTTQSVISRLESGRHPIEIKLLARIATAVGEPLLVTFGATEPSNTMPADQGSVTDSATTADQPAPPTSGDELLDRFNRANTSQEWGASHKLAAEIDRDPSTPRRQLALAIDAYNCHECGEPDPPEDPEARAEWETAIEKGWIVIDPKDVKR